MGHLSQADRPRSRTTSGIGIELAFPIAVALGIGYWYRVFAWLPALNQDFATFYSATQGLHGATSVYEQPDNLALLPPHALFFLRPLVACSPIAATYIWLVLNTLGFLWSAWVIARERGIRPTRLEFAAAVCFPAIVLNGLLGQCVGLLAVPAVLGWRDLRRGHALSAGVWFGMVAAVKPFMGSVGLLFVYRKQWEALASLVVTGFVAVLLGLLWYGRGVYIAWLSAGRLVDGYNLPANASVVGFTARLLPNPHPSLQEFPVVALIVAALIGGAVVMLSCRLLRRGQDLDRDLAVTILATLLVFPLGWLYYVPLCAGPLIALWRRRCRVWFGRTLPLLLLWWPAGLWWSRAPSASITWQRLAPDSFYFLGLLALWMFVAIGSFNSSVGGAGLPIGRPNWREVRSKNTI